MMTDENTKCLGAPQSFIHLARMSLWWISSLCRALVALWLWTIVVQAVDGDETAAIRGGAAASQRRGLFLWSGKRVCPDARRCTLGGVTMHRGDGASCREKCVWFPRLKPSFECGSCTTFVPPPAPSPGYDITLGFDSVPDEDFAIFRTAAARWERIITNDFADVSSEKLDKYAPNCQYPAMIDDFYLCILYGNIDSGPVVGIGGYEYTRSSGTVLAGFVKLKRSSIAEAKQQGYLLNIILHEMGHALVRRTLCSSCPRIATLARFHPATTIDTKPISRSKGHWHDR
jgi:hypothetical protein